MEVSDSLKCSLELLSRKSWHVSMVKRKNMDAARSDQDERLPLTDPSSDCADLVTVRCGNVTVTGPRPSPDKVMANVRRSTKALVRVADRLCKPGVTLRPRKGVPRYSLDRDDPKIIIRKLDGCITRGFFANGGFQEFE